MHYVIPSEYNKLGNALKDNLFSFGDHNGDYGSSAITLPPFMETLCPLLKPRCLREYVWVLHDDQLVDLKGGGLIEMPPSFRIAARDSYGVYSEEFIYKLSGSDSVVFVFVVQRAGVGQNKAVLGIEIKQCPKQIGGTMSVMVDELKWFKNGYNLNNLKKGSFPAFYAFADGLVQKLQSLTIRVAMYVR